MPENFIQNWAEGLEGKAKDKLQEAVKDIAIEVAEQMTYNLSGNDVSWSGGNFIVNVQTGNLRRHTAIEYPFAGDPYSAFVYNNAAYAGMIESGITGEQRKDMLLSSSKAKRSKKWRKYLRIPFPGDLKGFWTVTEDTKFRDQTPRPFAQATAEQMQGRIQEQLGNAVIEVLGNK